MSASQSSHDDGVEILACPLWPLFRHKPWQKVLKETREKLETGDHDWARLAIAQGLEHLYAEPETAQKKTQGINKLEAE